MAVAVVFQSLVFVYNGINTTSDYAFPGNEHQTTVHTTKLIIKLLIQSWLMTEIFYR